MVKSKLFVPRFYRNWLTDHDLVSFQVSVKETDLLIRATKDLTRKAEKAVYKYREQLEKYISSHPDFLVSLVPLSVEETAASIVKIMAHAAEQVGVGPMASVAGAIAQLVGEELLEYSPEVIIENGGDIYIKSLKERTIGIYAGKSPWSGKIGLIIKPENTPLGICTSSGTVGHSLSFGKTDAALVVASSAALADAGATALGNLVTSTEDVEKGIRFISETGIFIGALVIIDKFLGAWGNIELTEISTKV